MKTRDRRWVQGVISRRYMGRFILCMVLLTVFLVGVTFLAILILGMRTWYADDPFYQLLSFIQSYYVFFFAAAWLGGMIVILFLLWRQVAKSFLALTEAIEQMSRGEDMVVKLPDDLREVQGLLQQVATEAERNRRLAAEAEQRKSDLVVYLAHDLKTPLTSVLGYLMLLRDEKDISPQLQQKYLSIATNKALRLEDLINEFFEITRFSLKGLTVEPVKFNFSRMLEQVASEFTPLFETKRLTCVTLIQPDILVVADAGKLERVVDNLLRNAVSYSYPGTEIFLGVEATESRVSILVRNHGDTIPPHKLNHIFEQFYRVGEARSADEGGAGLGLAIAKEIVELHGGSIVARSVEQLIEFEVQFPVGDLPPELAATASFSLIMPAVRPEGPPTETA